MLQELVCAGRLLSELRECQCSDDNTTPIEADHKTDDDTSELVFESHLDDIAATLGAGVYCVEHRDADAQLARL